MEARRAEMLLRLCSRQPARALARERPSPPGSLPTSQILRTRLITRRSWAKKVSQARDIYRGTRLAYGREGCDRVRIFGQCALVWAVARLLSWNRSAERENTKRGRLAGTGGRSNGTLAVGQCGAAARCRMARKDRSHRRLEGPRSRPADGAEAQHRR